jgi:general secretion pathway protein B
MSYILDALRKSESDRYQEKLPELGGQAPLWLKKRGRRSIWPALVVAALLVNALVAGVLLWHRQPPPTTDLNADPNAAQDDRLAATESSLSSAPARLTPSISGARLSVPPEAHPETATGLETVVATERETVTEAEVDNEFETEASVTGVFTGFVRKPLEADSFSDETGSETLQEEALEDEVISPQNTGEKTGGDQDDAAGSTSGLAGIPLIDDLSSEEKSRIPALKFSSHIYSSASDARRIVINQRYLREGQSVQGLRVVEITEEGVVLSLSGRVFQIPVLRDWSPDGS